MRPRLLLAPLVTAVLTFGLAPAATATPAAPALSYAYLSTSRSGAAVYVNGLVKQGSASGIIRSPKRTVYLQRELGGTWQNVLSRTTDWYGTFSVGYLSPPSYAYRLLVTPSGSATGATSATATPPLLGRTLGTGSVLIAGFNEPNSLPSPSGVFELRAESGSIEIGETENLPDGTGYGTTTWIRAAAHNPYGAGDKSRLTMQNDGNLVLRASDGVLIWASHTSGTGSRNVLYMQNDGNLVIYNPAGRAVWQSGTSRMYLIAGRTLDSGQQMIDRLLQGYRPDTRMVMQSGGDLVISYGNTVTWHSDTHVPGSRAYMSNSGSLVVYSPANQVLWQSNTPGRGGALLLNVCGQADIYHEGGGPTQFLPPGPQRICG